MLTRAGRRPNPPTNTDVGYQSIPVDSTRESTRSNASPKVCRGTGQHRHKFGKQRPQQTSHPQVKRVRSNHRVLQHQRRQSENQRERNPAPSSSAFMPSIIGAAIIGACILLSTLITAVGTRYVGFEGPSDETAWLVDRLTGTVYKCHAAEQGKASCEDQVTGSVSPPKH
jgi:hypothetical protein